MTITNKYKRILITDLIIRREDVARQRDEIDTTDIDASIKKRGVIQPIIVESLPDGKYLLIAGERRTISSQKNGILDIPARMVQDLTETERQILELEENVKRKELPWKREVLAVKRIHELYMIQATTDGTPWTQERTAEEIGVNGGVLSVMLRVAEDVEKAVPQILAAGGYRAAYNIISRKEGRQIDDAMNDLLSGPDIMAEPAQAKEAPTPAPLVSDAAVGVKTPGSPPTAIEVRMPKAAPPPESILNQSFLEWAPVYDGQPFNFIHCDFPYGIDFDKSEQGGSGKQWEGYEDSEETYWKLCGCLATNLDRLMTQSGHLMFWLSSDIRRQYATIEFFRKGAPDLAFQTVPITWHKTDNKGILPDPKRQPRRVTETALLASRGDRLIIKAVSNAYGAPTSKEIHQSEKPEPVLRHFFQMFVDGNTRLLDPTCGSATALRAAESLGATAVFGLEINPDFVEAARIALRKFRTLRSVTAKKD